MSLTLPFHIKGRGGVSKRNTGAVFPFTGVFFLGVGQAESLQGVCLWFCVFVGCCCLVLFSFGVEWLWGCVWGVWLVVGVVVAGVCRVLWGLRVVVVRGFVFGGWFGEGLYRYYMCMCSGCLLRSFCGC